MHYQGQDFRGTARDIYSDGRNRLTAQPLTNGLQQRGDPASLAIHPTHSLNEWQPVSDTSRLYPDLTPGARPNLTPGTRLNSPNQPSPPPPPPPSLPDIGPPYTGGTWGAPGVRYNVTFSGFTATPPSGEAGPEGGIVEGPFTVSGIGTLTLRVVGANGTQTNALLSTFNPWVAIKFISIVIVP